MANEIFTFEEQDIDLKDSSKIKIKCFLNDDIILKINVYNYGEGVDLTKYNKEIRFYKPDGKVYSETRNIQINNNQMIVTCDRQLTTVSDTVTGFIRLWDNYNKQKASYPIEVVVQDNNGTREISQTVLSETEYFDNNINTALQIETHFDNNINVAKNEEVKLTDKISESVTSKNNLDKSNITANNTKSILDQSNANALKTKNDLDVLNNTSITTKGNLDKTNNTALTTNNTLNTTNTNAINTNNTLNTTIKSANDNRNALDTSKTNAINTKKDLDGSIENAKNKKSDLDRSINLSVIKKNELDGSINNANKAKQILDSGNSQAITNKKDLDESNVQASKNLDALNALGNATDLAKDVEIVKEQVLENTYTKLETDSTLTKLESCKDSFVHNMHIKGRTLQNLWDGGNITWDNNFSGRIMEKCESKNLFKQNTTYTIINYSNKHIVFDLNKIEADVYSRGITTTANSKAKFILNNEIIAFKIGSSSNGWTNSDNDKNELKKSIMVLEGDWTNKEIPPYFEGIKSVGELEDNKISILTCGKNMVDVMKLKDSPTVKIKSIDKNVVILEQIVDNRKYVQIPIYLTFKPNTKYVLSGNLLSANTCLKIYDLENNIQYSILEKTGSVMFTTREKSNLQLLFYTSNTENENIGKIASFENVMIEEGTTATSYEQYKADKTEILLPSPHMGLPNGTSDIVDFEKNERIKNVGKGILNGSEGWYFDGTSKQGDTMLFILSHPSSKSGIQPICDTFVPSVSDIWNTDTPAIHRYWTGTNIFIRILKSKLSTSDVAGFKKWLQANPTTVYYQLATPIIEKLNIKDTLQSFENGYIQLDNAITPCTQLEYSTNIMSIVSRMVENQDKVIDRLAVLESTILTLVSNNITNK